jgi:hypothetical protein
MMAMCSSREVAASRRAVFLDARAQAAQTAPTAIQIHSM